MLRQSRTVLGIDLAVVLCVLAANIGGEQLSRGTFRLHSADYLRCAQRAVAHELLCTLH